MRDVEVSALIERIVERVPHARRDELRRELRAHFEDAGTSDETVREAVRRFGSGMEVADAMRRVYDPSGLRTRLRNGADALLQDLRFGLRMLRRSPAFSALAIVCLTVGIGATAAVFSWIEGILLRPYPLVVDQDRLVAIAGIENATGQRDDVSW